MARRCRLDVTVIANSWMRVPDEAGMTRGVVADGFDAADDWMVEHAPPDDIVVTADIPLANRCLKQGGHVSWVRPEGRSRKTTRVMPSRVGNCCPSSVTPDRARASIRPPPPDKADSPNNQKPCGRSAPSPWPSLTGGRGDSVQGKAVLFAPPRRCVEGFPRRRRHASDHGGRPHRSLPSRPRIFAWNTTRRRVRHPLMPARAVGDGGREGGTKPRSKE